MIQNFPPPILKPCQLPFQKCITLGCICWTDGGLANYVKVGRISTLSHNLAILRGSVPPLYDVYHHSLISITTLWCLSPLLHSIQQSLMSITTLWCLTQLSYVYHHSLMSINTLWCLSTLFDVCHHPRMSITTLWCLSPPSDVYHHSLMHIITLWCLSPLCIRQPSDQRSRYWLSVWTRVVLWKCAWWLFLSERGV